MCIYIYMYIPGTYLSFVLPPKEGLFQSKQGSFGFQVYTYYFFQTFSNMQSSVDLPGFYVDHHHHHDSNRMTLNPKDPRPNAHCQCRRPPRGSGLPTIG